MSEAYQLPLLPVAPKRCTRCRKVPPAARNADTALRLRQEVVKA